MRARPCRCDQGYQRLARRMEQRPAQGTVSWSGHNRAAVVPVEEEQSVLQPSRFAGPMPGDLAWPRRHKVCQSLLVEQHLRLTIPNGPGKRCPVGRTAKAPVQRSLIRGKKTRKATCRRRSLAWRWPFQGAHRDSLNGSGSLSLLHIIMTRFWQFFSWQDPHYLVVSRTPCGTEWHGLGTGCVRFIHAGETCDNGTAVHFLA
jgi:hypothetical protein